MEAAGWRCEACGRSGRLEVDHKTRLEAGGAPYDPENLQALCRGCHIAKTAAENRRQRTEAEEAWAALVAELL